jgi:DNA polymerase
VFDILDCGPRNRFVVRPADAGFCLIAHNCTQATARDILAVKIRESEDAGMPVVLHVHDEIVVEVPEADAEEAKTELNRIMSTAPEWAPGLPMRSDTKILRRYGK